VVHVRFAPLTAALITLATAAVKLILKLGKELAKKGFDFAAGVLQYERKAATGQVTYAGEIARLLAK
jgi:hypothetical protein